MEQEKLNVTPASLLFLILKIVINHRELQFVVIYKPSESTISTPYLFH